MDLSFDLLGNAIVSGILLGGFYAAVSIGVAISFGMLDIVNIAHPAFIIARFLHRLHRQYLVGHRSDPGQRRRALPAFYLLGVGIYSVYEVSFERRGDTSLRGLSFFFGLLFITEVTLVLVFGVDYRLVEAPYIGPSMHLGEIELPLRLLVPCLVSLAMLGVLQPVPVAQFPRPRGAGGGAGPAGIAADGGQPHRASSASRSACRSPQPRSPAQC